MGIIQKHVDRDSSYRGVDSLFEYIYIGELVHHNGNDLQGHSELTVTIQNRADAVHLAFHWWNLWITYLATISLSSFMNMNTKCWVWRLETDAKDKNLRVMPRTKKADLKLKTGKWFSVIDTEKRMTVSFVSIITFIDPRYISVTAGTFVRLKVSFSVLYFHAAVTGCHDNENTECHEASTTSCVPVACNELFNQLMKDSTTCCFDKFLCGRFLGKMSLRSCNICTRACTFKRCICAITFNLHSTAANLERENGFISSLWALTRDFLFFFLLCKLN